MQFNSRAHCSLNICWCSPNLQCLRVFKTCEFFVDQWNFSYYCYFVSLNSWFRYPCVLVCRFVFYLSALFRNNDSTSKQMNAAQAWSFFFNKPGIREYLIPQMKTMNYPDQNRTLVPCSLFSGCQVQSSACDFSCFRFNHVKGTGANWSHESHNDCWDSYEIEVSHQLVA